MTKTDAVEADRSSTLGALAARVEEGETGFELGIAISNALFKECPVGARLHCVEAAGGSLDDCVTLGSVVAPGHYWMIDGSSQKWVEASLTDGSVPNKDVREDVNRFFGHAPTECAARLAAILRASAKND